MSVEFMHPLRLLALPICAAVIFLICRLRKSRSRKERISHALRYVIIGLAVLALAGMSLLTASPDRTAFLLVDVSASVDEAETLKLFPGGVAALGFGSLALAGEDLRIRVKWAPKAYEMLKEKIYKYFSPVLRGLERGPLRVTSVAMTNTPAINHLDALAASANKRSDVSDRSDQSDRKGNMSKLEKALERLTGRDSVALGAECSEEDRDRIACEVEEKASLIEQVKQLLGLDAEASLEEVIAALKAETEKAKSADEKQVQLDELAASAEKKAHADLVAKGRAERKIVDADMEYINSLDSKALSAYLDHAAPKFPAPLDRKAAERKADAAALSAVDRIAIDSLRNAGIKDAETEYLKQKKGI